MPGVLRQAMERMLPKLIAQRELSGAMVVAVGTGILDQKDARKWLQDRQRAVQGGRIARRASSWEEHFANLRAAGLEVVVE